MRIKARQGTRIASFGWLPAALPSRHRLSTRDVVALFRKPVESSQHLAKVFGARLRKIVPFARIIHETEELPVFTYGSNDLPPTLDHDVSPGTAERNCLI